jgi:rubrerythrin
MANEKRLIDIEQAKRATYEEIFWSESEQAVVRNFLAKLPKVDAVEVVHGRNKTTLHPVDEFICSVCGYVCQDTHKYVYDEDGEYWSCYEFEFKYCPDCGAKMDGGNEDG